MNYNDETEILIIPENTELEIDVEQETTILTKVKLQEKTVTPTINQQEVTADIEYDALGKVTVEGVTSEIDSNIQPFNILNGVNILGVDGNVEVGIFPTGTIDITENGTHDVTNYESANVNVEPDMSDYFTETITGSITSVPGAIKAIKLFPSSIELSGTNADYLFSNFSSLLDIPQISFANINTMNYAFSSCRTLTTLQLLDVSNVYEIRNAFMYTSNLTTFGGLLNLGQAYSTSQGANYNYYVLDLSYCKKLTHESLMNIINNLYDIAGKGCKTQQLVLGSTNLAKLTAEEINLAVEKGWTVS